MKLSELIATYGDENVEFQPLDAAIDTISTTKAGTKITFGTDEPFDHNGTVKMGLVVWMDRERAAEIIAAARSISLAGADRPGPANANSLAAVVKP